MSTASGDSDHEAPPGDKRRRRRDGASKDSDREDETLAEKLGHLLSATGSGSDGSGNEHVEEDGDLELDDDFDTISDALERGRLQNKTFSELQLREIDRKNSILVNKILGHNSRAPQYKAVPVRTKISSSSVNRRNKQRQIERENMLLLKKIQSAKPFGLSKSKK